MTAIADIQTIRSARPGELLVYHVGLLARDRKTDAALDERASEVMKQEQRGWMEASQKRLGRDLYEYRAVKRRRKGRACDWPMRQDALMKRFSGRMK